MPSDRPRIATYTSEETLAKFKIISAMHGMSMSNYLNTLIEESIEHYEAHHGEIKPKEIEQ